MKETSHEVIRAALDIKKNNVVMVLNSLSFEETVVQRSVQKHIKWPNGL